METQEALAAAPPPGGGGTSSLFTLTFFASKA